AGRLDEAFYVERASTDRQKVAQAGEVESAKVPYFSLTMVPGGMARQEQRPERGSVVVVGLGPGDHDWMTPQSRRELAAATDLIGYGPYLDRVGLRPGQRHHPSDNTDEPERARLACT
ncbi:ATP-binding protein, partial [Mycobacteroides abscessus subsp. abscessus]